MKSSPANKDHAGPRRGRRKGQAAKSYSHTLDPLRNLHIASFGTAFTKENQISTLICLWSRCQPSENFQRWIGALFVHAIQNNNLPFFQSLIAALKSSHVLRFTTQAENKNLIAAAADPVRMAIQAYEMAANAKGKEYPKPSHAEFRRFIETHFEKHAPQDDKTYWNIYRELGIKPRRTSLAGRPVNREN